MTRITNFGRKRTYLEAGFTETAEDTHSASVTAQPTTHALSSTSTPETAPSKRKKGNSGERNGEMDGAVSKLEVGAGMGETGSKPLVKNISSDVGGTPVEEVEGLKPSAKRSKGALKAKKRKEKPGRGEYFGN
jgi:zinc finger CCHC domain-containing protein 9